MIAAWVEWLPVGEVRGTGSAARLVASFESTSDALRAAADIVDDGLALWSSDWAWTVGIVERGEDALVVLDPPEVLGVDEAREQYAEIASRVRALLAHQGEVNQ